MRDSSKITNREQEVLHLIAYEHSSKEIAKKLFVSYETVNSHRKNMMDKLGVKNTAGLVRVAFERGLMRVGQLACLMVLFLCSHEAQSQVLNDDKVNYQLRTKFGQWFLETDDGVPGESEMVFNFRAQPDTDDEETDLSNQGSDGNGSACITFVADCEGFCQSPTENNTILKKDDSDGEVDLHFIVFEDDDSPPSCTSTDRSYERDVKDLISVNSALGIGQNNWALKLLISPGNFSAFYEFIWRYSNGRKNSPLNFGEIENLSAPLTHLNSTSSKPSGAESTMGYENDWDGAISGSNSSHRSGADITYTFEVADIMQKITIETGGNVPGVDPHVFLYRGSPSTTLEFLKDNDDIDVLEGFNSRLTMDLCPGQYTIVVDAVSAPKEGSSALTLKTEPFVNEAGGLLSGGSLSVCHNVDLPSITGPAVDSINGCPPEYQWKRFNFATDEYEAISGKNGKDLTDYGKMDTTQTDYFVDAAFTKVSYYIRTTSFSGISDDSNRKVIALRRSSTDAGEIASDDRYIRSGHELRTGITDSISSSGTPFPLSYSWKIKRGINNEETLENIATAGLSPTQIGKVEEEIILKRITTNGCGQEVETNPIIFTPIDADGEIKGRITSPPAGEGTPILLAEVCAVPNPELGKAEDLFYAEVRCAMTSDNGFYTIDSLYTGDPSKSGIEYIISATFLDHDIQVKLSDRVEAENDSTQLVQLRNNATKDEINFEDVTTIPISGNVFHNYTNANNVQSQFGKKDVEVNIERVVAAPFGDEGVTLLPVGKDTTDAFGNYDFALPSPGRYRITPKLDTFLIDGNNNPANLKHVFDPPFYDMVVVAPADDIDFEDQEFNKFHISFGGACDRDIGNIQVTIKDLDNSNVYLQDFSVGNFLDLINLPARKYRVEVSEVTTGLSDDVKAVVGPQLTALGNIEFDVRYGVDTILIGVSERPVLHVTGFEELEQEICVDVDNVTQNISNVAILEQNVPYPMVEILVTEGPEETCKLDTGTFRVSSGPSNPETLTIVDGVPQGFQIRGGAPNILAPHTVVVSMTADSPSGLTSDQKNQTVLSTGSIANGVDFITVSPELPLLILHDPPTDGGYAHINKGTSITTESTTFKTFENGGGIDAEMVVGTQTEIGALVFGAFFSVENKVTTTVSGSLSTNQTNSSSKSRSTTTTFNEEIKTSSLPRFVGQDGDVVVTQVYNRTFAEVTRLILEDCKPTVKTDMGISKDSVQSTAFRTIWDIKNIILPDLEQARALSTSPDSMGYYDSQISNWQNILTLNEENIDKVISETSADSVKRVSIGAGVDYNFDYENSSGFSSTYEYISEMEEEAALKHNFSVAGNGVEGKVFVKFKQTWSRMPTEDVQTDTTTTMGYHFSDDDIGDQYLIAVYEDKKFGGTPLFNVEGGRSSCPYTPWHEEESKQMAKAKRFAVGIESATTAINVDPFEGHTFEIKLKNLAAQPVNYEIGKNFSGGQNSKVSISGSQSDDFQSLLAVDQEDVITVNVKKQSGPDNQTISIYIKPACDERFLNAQFISFNVGYVSEISPITMNNIVPRQSINSVKNPNLDINMSDYDKSKFDKVVLQYTNIKNGDAGYTTSSTFSFTKDQLANDQFLGTTKTWNTNEIAEDGDYYIKLTTTREGVIGTNGSMIIPITIDRSKPIVFGLPEPADDNLDINDNDVIAINYNENVCPNGQTSAIATIEDLLNGGPLITTNVTCSDDRLVIVEEGVSLNNRAPSLYRVKLSGVEDVYGNVADDYYWRFIVGGVDPSALACLPDMYVTNNNLNQDAINAVAYRALKIISEGLIPNFGTTSYKAQEVELSFGFEVSEGGVFEASIEDCRDEGGQ